jgi:hypothetical protein
MRLCRGRTWRGRNLLRLSGWNSRGLWNNWRRGRRRSLCFDSWSGRRNRLAWRGNHRSGWTGNHGWRRRGRSGRCGLHARHSGSGFLRCFIRYCLLFRFRFRVGQRAKVFAHSYGGFYFNRTGMRFFLGNSGFRQIINDGLRLDLELASQFVDSDLIRIGHCPPGPLLVPALV